PPWAAEGVTEPACIPSVVPLFAEKPLDLGVLHGDGTHTVAPKGAMGSATRALSPNKGRRVSRHDGQPWLCVLSTPRSTGQRDGQGAAPGWAERVQEGGQTDRFGPQRRLCHSQPRL